MPEDTSTTIIIPIIDDTVWEGNESFTINLLNFSGGAKPGVINSATVTINENEIPPPPTGSLQFEQVAYTIDEKQTQLDTLVTGSGGISGTLAVNYATATLPGDTATEGVDYVTDAGTLSFADGVLSRSFTIAINDDAVYEGDESFTVNITPVPGTTLAAQVSAKVNILENDPNPTPVPDPTPAPGANSIQFEALSYAISENSESLLIPIVPIGDTTSKVTFLVSAVEGTAQENTDYESVSNEKLTFEPGQTNMNFKVKVNKDNIIESTESFGLQIHGVNGDAQLGSPSSVEIFILDAN